MTKALEILHPEKQQQSIEIHTAAIQEVTMTITVNALPAAHHIMTATAKSADTPTSTRDGSVRTTNPHHTPPYNHPIIFDTSPIKSVPSFIKFNLINRILH